ncbi:hypothetical protein JXB27_04625 [Candidatus Woesearchaeota archaeon]|nr:hypothetical protein [Candidatus Woesearchaeota archaeon]
MVLCLLALPVFAVLSIFSIKYKKLTKDALDCLFETVTFRKCKSGLDDRIRSDVTGTFLKYSPRTARFFYRNYRIISWIILILFIASAYYSAEGLYNYAKYGNCNGELSTGFCVLKEAENKSETFIDNLIIGTKNMYYKLTGKPCSDTT